MTTTHTCVTIVKEEGFPSTAKWCGSGTVISDGGQGRFCSRRKSRTISYPSVRLASSWSTFSAHVITRTFARDRRTCLKRETIDTLRSKTKRRNANSSTTTTCEGWKRRPRRLPNFNVIGTESASRR
uniref:Uncharacterized protein n=1 Tax=Cacopsylla melanoneura TaxID=428564 RepID=A0A8D8RAB9_9HEMI